MTVCFTSAQQKSRPSAGSRQRQVDLRLARSFDHPGREQFIFDMLPGGGVQRGRLALLDKNQDEALRSRQWTDQMTGPGLGQRLQQWARQVLAERLPTRQ